MNNTPFHLFNKTIFITGASSGIGRQIAISASKMGAKVVVTGRNVKRLEETLSLLSGDGHILIKADLTVSDDLENLVQQLPQLDGVVMNAGIVKAYPIKYLNQKKIDETMGVNYNSVVLLFAKLANQRKLNQQGSVVFISSISSSFPPKGGSMYSCSKAALETFSKVVALEFQHLKIRSNTVSPGMVITPLYSDVENTVTKESMDSHIATYPLGVGYPEDVANSVIFLLSDASRWITGTNIILDGGCLLNG